MTTVVNFNILNLFGLQPQEYSLNDRSAETDFSDGRQNGSAGRERVIDVTPHSRVVSDNETGVRKEVRSSMNKSRPARVIKKPVQSFLTYNRQGNAVECCEVKGIHVDEYA